MVKKKKKEIKFKQHYRKDKNIQTPNFNVYFASNQIRGS